MELRKYCAYNETRESFLGLEVVVGDVSYKVLSREGALTVKPSGGLWLTPFRGIPESGTTAPIDLIFLDKQCRVIKLVESFPAAGRNTSMPAVDTLLVLPEHSIVSSETRVGDQLVLCDVDEMQRHLERRNTTGDDRHADRHIAGSSARPIGHRVCELVGVGEGFRTEDIRPRPMRENPIANQEERHLSSARKWLQRWWRRDLRQAPRKPVTGLQAYYWDGFAPQPHYVRDISTTGLYLVTDERWYPGTLVLLTLQDKDSLDEVGAYAVSVNMRAVHWGKDGVGLQFEPANDVKESQQESYGRGAGRKEFEAFLRRITK